MRTKEETENKTTIETVEKKKIVKFKYQNILIFLFIILIMGYLINSLVHLSVSNIYISGNNILSDQEVIEIANIENYPSLITHNILKIKSNLERNNLIIKAKVYTKSFSKVYIEITENRPLFYNSNTNKTVMSDGKELDLGENTPYLINYVPDMVYSEFVSAMSKVSVDTLNRISEILYDPNDVDTKRFCLTMVDGNYVYVTLTYFYKINNYVSIVKQFNNKKGILYLDSGEYFEIK